MNGEGVYAWPDGKKYIGEYKDDLKHGIGKMEYPDGKIYEGEWEAGKRHGKGKLTLPTGESRIGIWKDDIRIEWIFEATPEIDLSSSNKRTPSTVRKSSYPKTYSKIHKQQLV